jgi:hypothetical protein
MGNKQAKRKKSDDQAIKPDLMKDDLRIVRTYFDTPRNRAVLTVETGEKNMKIDRVDQMYFVTVKDRGLRTLEHVACNYAEAMARVTDWVQQYDCHIYKTDVVPTKPKHMSAAF